MNKIKTIEELTQKLATCSYAELKNIYKYLEIQKSEFEPYIFYTDQGYTRNSIIRTDEYELILMCWKDGQSSAIHTHDEQECWLYNVDGKFTEYRYQLTEGGEMQETGKFELGESNFSYMTDNMGYHDLHNTNNGASLSLHLYAKPLNKCKVYNHHTKGFDMKNLVYHSIDGKPTEHL